MTNEEMKQKWISALESGEFKQCRNVLGDGKNACCIGVFGIVNLGYSLNDIDTLKNGPTVKTESVYISFMNVFGPVNKRYAVSMNDNFECSFMRIAEEAKGWAVLPDTLPYP